MKEEEIILSDVLKENEGVLKLFPERQKLLLKKIVSPSKKDFKEAKEKIIEQLSNCNLCFKKCGINRLKEPADCGPPIDKTYIFQKGILLSERFSPTYAIYFSFCNLNCKACAYKKYWKIPLEKQKPFDVYEISKEINENFKKGEIKNLLLTGGNPDGAIYAILNLLEMINPSIPVILSTNGTYDIEFYDLSKDFIDFFAVSKNKLSKYQNINEKAIEEKRKIYIENEFIFDYNCWKSCDKKRICL